jgi:hypothetical protein
MLTPTFTSTAYVHKYEGTPGSQTVSTDGVRALWIPLAGEIGGGRLDGVKQGNAVTVWTEGSLPDAQGIAVEAMGIILPKV